MLLRPFTCHLGFLFAVGGILPFAGFAEALKTNTLKGTSSLDYTNLEVSITWTHHGMEELSQGNLCDTTLSGSVKFASVPGQMNSVSNDLCSQHQKSAWNVSGFNEGGGKFSWRRADDNTKFGLIQSTASLNGDNVKRSSESITSMTAGGFSASTKKATISNAGHDDSIITTAFFEDAGTEGRRSYLLNGTTILEDQATIEAGNGGMAQLIDGDGLRLLAGPNGFAEYSVNATNLFDATQTFSWSARFDSTGLSVTGINPNLFLPIPGGVFLPDALMPTEELTADLGPGDITYSAYDRAFDSAPGGNVPEPGTFVLVVAGSICLLLSSAGRRHTHPGRTS